MDTNLRKFQYKILNILLYLNDKLSRFKKVSYPLCSLCQSANETPIHLFHVCIKTNLLWYMLKKFIKVKIDLPINTPQSAIFGFLNHEYNTDIINHLLLIFNYCLFNSRVRKKLIPEVLKKEMVKIYNIEKQICLNDFKKFRKKREIIGHLLQQNNKLEIRINIVKMSWGERSVCFFFVCILLREYLQLCVCM